MAKRAGFDGIELNFNLASDISHKTSEKDFKKICVMAEKTGISISGLCTFLYWPYPFTANQESIRSRALELANQMIHAAHHLGTHNLLVVAGAVIIPWIKDAEAVPYRVCDERARSAIRKLIPVAEKLDVNLNIKIFFLMGTL